MTPYPQHTNQNKNVTHNSRTRVVRSSTPASQLAAGVPPIPGNNTGRPAGAPNRFFRPRNNAQRGGFRNGGGRGNGGPRGNRPGGAPSGGKKPHDVIPPLAPGDIRIIPIGGVEEIQKNMTLVEYNDQIIVIDAGTRFSTVDTPGINYIIPNTTYLEERKDKIKALVITHGHLDHIGAIPFVIEKLGNPPIYTREFGAILIKKRQEEYPHLPPLNVIIAEKDDGAIPISADLKVRFFGLTHAIPDSTGVIIETPHGDIVSTGDVRVDNHDGIPSQKEFDQYAFFKKRNVLLMTMDSTGIPQPGWSISEDVVVETVDKIIRDTKGRLIIATFASQVERIIEFIRSAKKYDKYIVIEGRAMKTNISIVQHLNLTDLDHVIDVEEMPSHPPHKIVMLATGGQGEQYSALDRIANGTHKFVTLTSNDTIVFSSSVIPGNDHAVDRIKDLLYKKDPHVITYADTQVHASGHGRREELKWLHQQIDYKFFMPIHGSHFRLKMHRDMVVGMGHPRENIIVPSNGTIVEIRNEGKELKVLAERAPHEEIVIDGTYTGELQEAVIRDRKLLNEEGFFTVVVVLDQKTRKLKKSPDIISRGSVYLRENQELLHKLRGLIKKVAEDSAEHTNMNIDDIKDEIGEKVSRFILQKTEKRPIVIPVVLSF
ncbi:MAG: ribonuclease J [Candidatus Pacebacteria bacterium]|nr:ribonuclease J [Candidatus Paceibacterota bacterium]